MRPNSRVRAAKGALLLSIVRTLPDPLIAKLYNRRMDERLVRGEFGWMIEGGQHDPLYLTDIQTAFRYAINLRGVDGMIRRKRSLREMEGFVTVEPGDFVVDVGAFIGEFTIAAVPDAGEIVSIEPDPRSFPVLSRNVERYDAVTTQQTAVWNESGDTIEFNLADDPTESGVLPPDTGEYRQTSLETRTLSDLFDSIDFVKIEAEGAEPEVVEGLTPGLADKVAVAAGAERYGERPIEEVRSILDELGYQIRVDDERSVVFARYPE